MMNCQSNLADANHTVIHDAARLLMASQQLHRSTSSIMFSFVMLHKLQNQLSKDEKKGASYVNHMSCTYPSCLS